MKPANSTRRAILLARANYHPYFTWELIWIVSSGKTNRHLDLSHNFFLLWIRIINDQCFGTKMSGHLGFALLLCLFIRFSAFIGEMLGSQWRDHAFES